jgi:hypothetical protein
MKIFGLVIKKEQKSSKVEDFDFKEELKRARLEHEKSIMDEKLKTIRKQQEYDQVLLDMKIKEQQALMEEKFSDVPEEVEDFIEESDDVPDWIKPYIGPLVQKFVNGNNQSQPSPISPQSVDDNSKGEGMTFTNEELKAIKMSASKNDISMLKSLPDAQIKSYIRGKYPKITDECLERAISILKS